MNPLLEVVGRTGTTPPEHIISDVPKSKTGMVLGVTVTVNVTGLAQTLVTGVKVYTPEAWLLTAAGLQVP